MESVAPSNPESLTTLRIPASYFKMSDDEDFLLFHSGLSADRILLFSTKKHLETLGNLDQRYMDGTFKSSASLFTQIFTTRGVKGKAILPFGLFPNNNGHISIS